MRMPAAIAMALLALAGCGGGNGVPATTNAASGTANAAAPAPASPAQAPPAAAGRWDLQSSGEGVALALLSASGETAVRLFCPAGADRLLVNVPAFRPIGSEERMSFGSGSEVAILVADPRGDPARGGVTGAGPVPADLAALVAGPIRVNYGAQNGGPHPAPPAEHGRAFVAACREGARAARLAAPAASACLVQDGERLTVAPLRALGTEPFWAARIEGRCVTYSHPEDQQGTRVWTRYAAAQGGGGRWSGALGGRRFELSLRPSPNCSDGMSDNRYPMAAELLVGGERRRGCGGPR